MSPFLPDSDVTMLHAGIHSGQLLIACLYIEWCGTCRSYCTTFTELAQRHSECRFVWINVEDHADALDDFNAENFPTLLVQRESDVLFSGPVLPHAGIVGGLILRGLGVTPAVPAAPDSRG